MGYWSGKEKAFEGVLPFTFSGLAFYHLSGLMGSVSVGKQLTQLELYVYLGSLACLVSWTVSRQMFLFGRRRPLTIGFFAVGAALGAIYGLSSLVVSNFEEGCTLIGGTLQQSNSFLYGREADISTICQVGGIPGNNYVPGTLVRPSWNGIISVPIWCFLAILSVCTTVAFRDKRIRRSKIVKDLYKLLEYAPGTGLNGALGGKPKDGKVQACTNPTFWGEICGQMYSAEKVFEPGEWCGRCNQTYVKAERELTFSVVSLFTDNIDLLNMLEKKDTLSWDVPGRIPADGRQSGVERWVVLGKITVPDVISVSQMLSIAHDMLKQWKSEDERTQTAIELAQKRASKLYGWIWFGRQNKRLTYARPTTKVQMAVGTTRIRDVVTDSGEELYLQLDIGLLPVEMRTAFLRTYLDVARIPRFQNSKFDMWVPVAPKLTDKLAGLWVPRIEGEAFRKWLSTGRIQEEGKRGVTVPRAYHVFQEVEMDDDNWRSRQVQQKVDLGGDILPGQESLGVHDPSTEWEGAQSEDSSLFEGTQAEEPQVDITDIFDFGEADDDDGWGDDWDDWNDGWEDQDNEKTQDTKGKSKGTQSVKKQDAKEHSSDVSLKKTDTERLIPHNNAQTSKEENKPQASVEAMAKAEQHVEALNQVEIDLHLDPGVLDIVRVPFNNLQTEPKLDGTDLGNSIAEWEWFEPEQIQLLRQQCLVLVDSSKFQHQS